jgi:NAD(P)-dependent dehydrogenase (short-subunit alcohol dehydrogenase family)
MSRVALVTGCSGGIGRALAEVLVAGGWVVYAGARDRTSLERLERAGCVALSLDVCDGADRVAAVRRVQAEQGRLDALVNNAGFGLHGVVEEVPLEDARIQFETNFFAVARLCQLVLPGMRERGCGHILNMSSMGGRFSFPGGAYYHASKHALEALSDVLRFEVGGFGIHVVLIEPGPVRSDFGRTGIDSLGRSEGNPVYSELRESIRSGLTSTFEGPGSERSSTPEEVAAVCLEAMEASHPRPRYVVGTMAEALIEQRREEDDESWDRFLAGLYVRPGPASSG